MKTSKHFEMTERSNKEMAELEMHMRAWRFRSHATRHNIAVRVIDAIGGHTTVNPLERRSVYSLLMNNIVCPEDLGITNDVYFPSLKKAA